MAKSVCLSHQKHLSELVPTISILAVRTQINRPPADTTVLLGHSAALECGVSSDPTVPYNIDWYREPK